MLRSTSGESIYVEAPQIVVSGNSYFLLGSPTLTFANSPRASLSSPSPEGVYVGVEIARHPPRLIPPPPNAMVLPELLAFADEQGSINMIWNSAKANRSETASSMVLLGNVWSEKTGIPPIPNVLWKSLGTAVSSDGYGVQAIVALSPLEIYDRPSLVAIRTGAGWNYRRVPKLFGIYAGIAVSRGSVTVSYVTNVAGDGNTLFTRTSRDGLRSWAPPVRVSHSGSGSVDWPKLHLLENGTLALVWISDSKHVRIALSRNDGRSWDSTAAYTSPSSISSFASADDRGVVYALVMEPASTRADRAETPALMVWNRHQWKRHSLSQYPSAFGVPALTVIGDTLLAAWGSPEASLATTVLARFQTSCNTKSRRAGG